MKEYINKILKLGRTVATPHACSTLTEKDMDCALLRHNLCDWGDICEEDWQKNNTAFYKGLRIFSAYTSSDGDKFWIITEADRSYTTVLMPSDY